MTEEGIRPISVQVYAPEGSPPVSGTTLRAVRVWALVQHALTVAVEHGQANMTEREGHVAIVGRAVELSDEDVARIRAQGPTDESLAVVARFYNLAGVLGLPPAKQVELNLDLPRTTASKWVRRAREKGLLGDPATGRRTPIVTDDEPKMSDTERREHMEQALHVFGWRDDRGEHPEA